MFRSPLWFGDSAMVHQTFIPPSTTMSTPVTAEELRSLRERNRIVDHELWFVAVQIGELGALMVDEQQSAVFGTEKRVRTGIRNLGGGGGHVSSSSFAAVLVRRESVRCARRVRVCKCGDVDIGLFG
jgi:hypothetical protein